MSARKKGHIDEIQVSRKYSTNSRPNPHSNDSLNQPAADRFSPVFDRMLEGFQVIDFDWRYVYLNEAVVKHSRKTREALLGNRIMDVYPGIENSAMFILLKKCMHERTEQSMDNEFVFPDGQSGWFRLYMQPLSDGVMVLSVEITDLVKTEKCLTRINRALKTLSRCNRALVHSTDEFELLDAVCNVITSEGGYRLAWVGYAQKNRSKSVLPVAQAGFEQGYLESAGITWSDSKRGKGPTGTAIRTGTIVIARNIISDPNYGPWRLAAIERGYKSSIALPIKVREETIGALNIYSNDQEAFDSEEIELLTELATDMGYGIGSLRTASDSILAEQQLRLSEQKYSTLVEKGNDGIAVIQDGSLVFANIRFCQMIKCSIKNILNKPFIDFISPQMRHRTEKQFYNLKERKITSAVFETELLSSQGKGTPVEISSNLIDANDTTTQLAILRDISQRKRMQARILESEERYRSLINHSYDAVLLTDPDSGDILSANPAACSLFGRSEKEICHVGRAGVVNLKDPRLNQALKDRIQKGFFKGELSFNRKDGTVFEGEVSSSVFLDYRGNRRSSMIIRDVGERKRLEHALRDSEARQRIFSGMTSDFVYVIKVDKSGKLELEWISDSFYRIMGYSIDESKTNTDFFACVHPDDLKTVMSHHRDVIRGIDIILEMRITTKQGEIRWVRNYSHPVWDNSHKFITTIYGAAQDITEQKKVQQSLQQEKEILQLFVENSPAAIAMFDRNMHYMAASRRYTKDYQLGEQSVIGRSHYEVFPEIPERWKRIHKRCLAGAVERAEEDPFVRLSGEMDWIRWEIRPWYETGGYIGGIILFSEVITEKKKMEEALRDSEQRYRMLVSASPDGVVALNMDGTISYTSEKALEMFGVAHSQDIAGSALPDWVVAGQTRQARHDIETILDGGHVGQRRYLLRKLDGSSFWGELNSAVIKDQNGNSKGMITIIRDITKHKEIEDRLVDEATRRRVLIDQSRDGIVILDQDGKVYESNLRFAEMLGYSTDEMKSLKVFDWEYLHPEESTLEMIRSVDETGDHFETRHRRKDGTTYDVEISTNAAVFSGQKLIFCVCRDITRRKQIEAALRESEERYRLLVERSPTAIGVHQDGRVVFVNSAAVKLLGAANAREVLGKPIDTIVHPERWSAAQDRIMRMMKGEKGLYPSEDVYMRLDGTPVPVQVTAAPLTFHGRPAIQVIVVDISEMKKAQETLYKSEERFRTMVNSMEDVIFTLDTNMRHTGVYGPWVSRMGLAPENFLGKTAKEIFGAAGYHVHEEANLRALKGEFVVYDWDIKDKGGNRYYQTSLSPMKDQGGSIIGIVGIGREVTERIIAEKEKQKLRDKAEISARLASVGEMAAGIAHEINNPLTSVLGFSELLSKEDLPKNIGEYVKYIIEGSNRVKEIVKRLLTFSRQTQPARTRLNIHELIDNTLELRSYVLSTANIQVFKYYDPKLPWVVLDPGQIQQVLMNLIVNAEYSMKKAHDGGILTITTNRTSRLDKEYVEIIIQDNGLGMDQATLSKLFQPFFTTKEPGTGTGLGLSLSRSIVIEHGGTIEVSSEPDAGATFTIRLPVNQNAGHFDNDEPQKAIDLKPLVAKASVLVIDDEEGVRTLIKRALSSDGHSVDTQGQAAKALENLEQKTYDVVFIDMRMPGMSGKELFERIKDRWPELCPKIVFVTGDASDPNTMAFLKHNKLQYMSKPFDKNALVDKLNQMVRPQGTGNK